MRSTLIVSVCLMLCSCKHKGSLNGHWVLESSQDSTRGYLELFIEDSLVKVYDDDAIIHQHFMDSEDFKASSLLNYQKLKVTGSNGTEDVYVKLLQVPNPIHLSDSLYQLRRYQYYLDAPYEVTNGQSRNEWLIEYEQFISGVFRLNEN